MTKALLPLLLSLPLCAADWETLPPLPVASGGGIVGVHHGKVVVAGGTNWSDGVKHWLKSVYAFDPDSKTWAALPDLPHAVGYGVSLAEGDTFRLLGGSDGQQPLPQILSLDGKITPLPGLGKAVVLSAGGAVGEGFVLVGGTPDAADIAGITRQTSWVTAAGVTPLAEYPGKALAVAAHAVVRGELCLFGGMNYDAVTKLPVNSAAAYAFSPKTNTWRTLKSLPKPTRGLTAVALDDDQIYLAGGYSDDNFSAEAWIYQRPTDSYTPAKPLPQPGMVGLVKLGSHVYCIGGEDKMKSRTDRCYRVGASELVR